MFVVVGLLVVSMAVSTGIALHYRALSYRSLGLANRSSAEAAQWKSAAQASGQDAQVSRQLLLDLKAKVEATVGSLDAPRFVTWNSPTWLVPGGYLLGTVPDTFTLDAELTSTAPIKLMIMTAEDFACWRTNVCASQWVYWGPSRYINAVFHGAEGCGDYLAIITGSGRVVPNVSAIRHSAHRVTGACR